jgi:hypothetical protein
MGALVITQLTLSPVEFGKCDAFGFGNAEIKPNGCSYVLAAPEQAESSEGSASIECPEGKAIEVIARSGGLLKCDVTIGLRVGLRR